MPQGRLGEKYIQNVAVGWLADYYRSRLGTQAVCTTQQVGVSHSSRLGSGIADGLIAARLSDGTIFTASLEAKSYSTNANVRPRYKDAKLLLHSVLVGSVGLIVAGFIGWSIGGWFWSWVFPFLAFVIIGSIYFIATFDRSRYRPIDAIAQIKRYPANEQWIVLSTDVHNMLNGEKQLALHKDCQREGIGLLRISAGKKVTLMEVPKPHSLPKGYDDFLVCYAKGHQIRRKLADF